MSQSCSQSVSQSVTELDLTLLTARKRHYMYITLDDTYYVSSTTLYWTVSVTVSAWSHTPIIVCITDQGRAR